MFGCTHQKNLKLGMCIFVNLVKSHDSICILSAVLYFTDQHLVPFYRLFFRIANLEDTDLKFSGLFSDVDIGSPAKMCEAST